MKRPLFWKLLLGSWITLLLLALGNAFVIWIFLKSSSGWAKGIIARAAQSEIAIAAQVFRAQGAEGVRALNAALQAGQHVYLRPGASNLTGWSGDTFTFSRIVTTPSGTYTLVHTTLGYSFFPQVAHFLSVPVQLLAVDFVAVSVFSVLIAGYLAGPIHRLRSGLKRVSDGDLSVRVYPSVARRRDEMAELALDFDRMAERLQQLLDAQERLLHDVSHEFRSPLTRLRLAVDLARQRPERALASLDRIEHEAQRLSDLVGEILTLSRAEFSAARSETYFDVADLVATAAADASFEAEPTGVAVRAEISNPQGEGDGPIINGSPELLRKGIDNLLRNAVKVSRSGQTVTVRLTTPSARDDKIRIEVIDEGPGVPESELNRIFEPFVRLDGQPQGSGYGLGLAIARSAAQAHNGAIWAANRPAGGLTITFELPVKVAASAQADASPASV